MSVAEVAERTPTLRDPQTVKNLEAGRFELSDTELESVVGAYGIDLAQLVPQRSELVIDLDGRTLAIGQHQVAFSGARSKMSDEVLTRYLSMVRVLRSLPEDAEVSLRHRDLRTLSTALVVPADEIRFRLDELMVDRPGELRSLAARLAGRPLIPSLGILVSATAVGALLFASATPSASASTSSTAPATSISTSVSTTDVLTSATAVEDLGGNRVDHGPMVITTSPATTAPTSTSPTTSAPTSTSSPSTSSPPTTGPTAVPTTVEPIPTTGHPPATESTETVVETTIPASALLAAEPATQSPGTTVPGDAPASSGESSTSRAEPSLAEIEQAALARISYDVDRWLPGWTIEFKGPVAGYRGMTHTEDQRIEIYPRPGQTIDEIAHTLAHELGHAVDLTYNDQADRLRWREARGIDADHPWFVGDGLTDFGVGAGDFADCFAYWQIGGSQMHSELGGTPNQQQLNLLAELSFY